tara:strand:+ start:8961 stop:9515 length:555 start_codon:yes stop_codon:yes gene_type:complete
MAGSRALNSVITDQLSAGKFIYVHLIKLSLNTTYYYTDSAYNILYDSNTYSSNAFISNVPNISEQGQLTTGSFKLTISSVTQTVLSDALNNGYINKEVLIQKAFLNDSNVVLSSGSNYAVFTVAKGTISGMSIGETESVSAISFDVQNHWAYFDRVSGRQTTRESQNQQGFTYTDVGFDWMTKV